MSLFIPIFPIPFITVITLISHCNITTKASNLLFFFAFFSPLSKQKLTHVSVTLSLTLPDKRTATSKEETGWFEMNFM